MLRTIDLADFRKPPTIRVFSGRARGEAVRLDTQIPRLEQEGNEFEVRVPDNVMGITASFFLGMFGDSVRALGADEFRRRYRFTGKDVRLVVEEGIEDALKTGSPLSGIAKVR